MRYQTANKCHSVISFSVLVEQVSLEKCDFSGSALYQHDVTAMTKPCLVQVHS